MSRLVRLALVLVTWAACLPAFAEGAATRADASALSLRLADGSFIRVPCDRVAPEGTRCSPSTARDSASLGDAPRRAPLKRRAPVFDVDRPGVVASVRG